MYVNHEESTDYFSSRGFNYHNGPEWVWPMCFLLRARIAFADDGGEMRRSVLAYIEAHRRHLEVSAWQGLPELQNSADGARDCPESCPTQAWSMACMLEVLHDAL